MITASQDVDWYRNQKQLITVQPLISVFQHIYNFHFVHLYGQNCRKASRWIFWVNIRGSKDTAEIGKKEDKEACLVCVNCNFLKYTTTLLSLSCPFDLKIDFWARHDGPWYFRMPQKCCQSYLRCQHLLATILARSKQPVGTKVDNKVRENNLLGKVTRSQKIRIWNKIKLTFTADPACAAELIGS
jgi:hypothetical protein